MLALVVAGEAVFGLPFHVIRFFRPAVLDVFGFTNTQLGAVMATYGVVATLSYFPGGPLADRFSARRLLTISLVVTGLGGLYFATGPDYDGLMAVFGLWGASTILLFWAAMIRATREWGGPDAQGRAFGLLDGGRGLLAAVTASVAVAVFALLLPDDPTTATLEQRAAALRGIVHIYTGLTLASAALVWFTIPEPEGTLADPGDSDLPHHIARVLRMPGVWIQAVIVVCAYVAFKGLDTYSLMAVEVFGMNEVEAAQVTAVGAWIRPPAALAAGLLADRVRASTVSAGAFAALTITYVAFALGDIGPNVLWALWANIVVVCAAIFGLRGVYFALFEEASVPPAFTGTATGLVSVIGYTPDIFVAPIAGYLLDASPGVAGHQQLFGVLAGFVAVGFVACLAFSRVRPR